MRRRILWYCFFKCHLIYLWKLCRREKIYHRKLSKLHIAEAQSVMLLIVVDLLRKTFSFSGKIQWQRYTKLLQSKPFNVNTEHKRQKKIKCITICITGFIEAIWMKSAHHLVSWKKSVNRNTYLQYNGIALNDCNICMKEALQKQKYLFYSVTWILILNSKWYIL